VPWTRFGRKRDIPGGLWTKCESCGELIFRKDLEKRGLGCPECNHHFTLLARQRLAMTVDEGSFEEHWADLTTLDYLEFSDRVPYPEKIAQTAKKTGENEAAVAGTAAIHGIPVAIAVLDFAFLGGSMGVVVGEKVARTVELALERRLPLITFTSSGGARMHEGALSLMQMAKTCGVLSRLHDAGGFYISMLTHPTTGGVTASFASVADIIAAEPGALIGCAGPRVIQTTIRQDLPPGFQRAEFLLEKGQIDLIIDRPHLRETLARLLAYSPLVQVPDDFLLPGAGGEEAGREEAGGAPSGKQEQ